MDYIVFESDARSSNFNSFDDQLILGRFPIHNYYFIPISGY